MTSYGREIAGLEAEWSPESGFFWKLRGGDFDPDALQRALGTLTAMFIPEDAHPPRRFVSLLWYIPIFMQWQVDRVRENGGDLRAYTRGMMLMTNEVERLLGVP